MRALPSLPRLLLGLAVVGGALTASGLARAGENQDLEESDKLPAVQNRLYRTQHEFAAGVGVLPIDPFVKGVTFTGGYAWHINDLWGVEGRFSYLRNIKTSLRDKLENNFAIPSTQFAELAMYGEASALFKPLYGKLSLLNKTLVYGEFYLSLSGIIARMTGGTKTEAEPQGKGPRLGFGGAPGFGLRGYLNAYTSMRFDFRYLLLYSRGEMHYPLELTLSIAFTTRSDL